MAIKTKLTLLNLNWLKNVSPVSAESTQTLQANKNNTLTSTINV